LNRAFPTSKTLAGRIRALIGPCQSGKRADSVRM